MSIGIVLYLVLVTIMVSVTGFAYFLRKRLEKKRIN
jgi:hypothetical protein